MLWLRQISACLILVAVAACSAMSVDSNKAPASQLDPRLGQIRVEIASERIEQIYRQRLERLLARSERGEGRYTISVKMTASYPTDAVEMTASIRLYDQKEGRDLMNTSFKTSASVGAVASLFGAEEAKANARERLAASLAEKTYHRLFLYFSQNDGNDGS